jgi:two-component system sensor kinase FixL
VPLLAGDNVLGALALLSADPAPPWGQDAPGRLRLIADVFASALARKDAEAAARRAEAQAQTSRQELAHFLRVSTVGEMATSLAHELNQPLTAILANAQAARRLLKEGPETSEVREILSDVADEGKRAGEVIRRLRGLLRKGEPERLPLNLNSLVREVVKLVSGDALLRGVVVSLDLRPDPLTVTGDRIQIQQVLLNLLINAMDSMSVKAAQDRNVVVRSSRVNGMAEVQVIDSGHGIEASAGDSIFNPFVSTKPDGMGMGLSIAKSIVEAHRGTLSGRNNPEGGATFAFTLPVDGPLPASAPSGAGAAGTT